MQHRLFSDTCLARLMIASRTRVVQFQIEALEHRGLVIVASPEYR
jgi:hypothetical protein